jgi:hypothetical protein
MAIGGDFGDDNDNAPIDSRNVSGSDDEVSFSHGQTLSENQDDEAEDDDQSCSLCTRDEELSVPGDEEGSSCMDDDSRSLTPSSNERWGDSRPLVPPLDLR